MGWKINLVGVLVVLASACNVKGGHKNHTNSVHKGGIVGSTPSPAVDPSRCPKRRAALGSVLFTSSSKVGLCIHPPEKTTQVQVHLSPEPSMSPQSLLSELSGSARHHVITGLSPDTHLFIRLTMIPSGTQTLLYAKTGTGQAGLGYPLDTKVREVYLVRGDILAVKATEEYYETASNSRSWKNRFETDPKALQKGTWTVTRSNGKSIDVRKVHRFSRGVNMADRSSPRDLIIDVDHILYLYLGELVGRQEILRVKGPQNTDFLFPFSDNYASTPAIRVNQLGYMPAPPGVSDWERWAYVSQWAGDGGSVEMGGGGTRRFSVTARALVASADPLKPRRPMSSGETALQLPVSPRTGVSTPDSSKHVLQIDLSRLPAREGTGYFIQVPGMGVSYETSVSWTGVFKAFYEVGRALTHNRWGHDMPRELSPWGPLYPDHLVVYDPPRGQEKAQGFFDRDTPALKKNERVLRGGHHDAGDFDIRPQHVKVTKDLLAAYEINPAAFTDGQWNIPESGNGIPDILDEAVWSLYYLRQLQEKNGGVHGGVETHRHPRAGYAHNDPLPYFRFSVDAGTTAKAAALFAWGARLLEPFDYPEASAFAHAAQRAWRFANNPANGAGPADGGAGPADGGAGRLPGAPCLLYAASQLYALTGEETFKTAFENLYRKTKLVRRELSGREASGCKVGSFEYALGYAYGPGPDAALVKEIQKKVLGRAEQSRRETQNDFAYRHPRKYKGVCLFGTCTAPIKQLMPITWLFSLGNVAPQTAHNTDAPYLNSLALGFDSVVGVNPLGQSFVTGLGSRMPTNLLHLDSIALQRERGLQAGPIPGFTVYGPTSELPGHDYYEPIKKSFYPEFGTIPHMLQDADALLNVNGREFAVHSMQAPTLRHIAAMIIPGLTVPASWKDDSSHASSATPASATLPRLKHGESIFEQTRMEIVSVLSPRDGEVLVRFNKPIRPVQQKKDAHFSIDKGVVVRSAELTFDQRTVRLSTSRLKDGTYRLTAQNLEDYSPESKSVGKVSASFVHSTQNQPPSISMTVPKSLRTIVLPKKDSDYFAIDGKGPSAGKEVRTRAILLTADIEDDRRGKKPLAMKWAQKQGPKGSQAPVLGDPFAPNTPVLFKVPGRYRFSLCVSDGRHSPCETIDIVVR